MADILRSQFTDLFLGTMLPAIDHLVSEEGMGSLEALDVVQTIFNVKNSTRSIEQTSQISGFAEAPAKTEGASVQFFTPVQGFDNTFTHTTYALGLRVTHEFVRDNQFDLVARWSRMLGRALFETKQIQCASIFNNGFTATTDSPDGQFLFDTDHGLFGSGGTEQNRLTAAADLSFASLRQALEDWADTRDFDNKRTNIDAAFLLHPAQLQVDVDELLKSPTRPDTANRAINSLSLRGLTGIMWKYLTDADAWFIVAKPGDHEVWYWDRESVQTKSAEDSDSLSQKVISWRAFAQGTGDWHGLYGSPGV